MNPNAVYKKRSDKFDRLPKIIALLMVIFVGACEKQDATILHIGTNSWIGYEPLYIAQEKGDLPESQYVLHRQANATEVMTRFASGELHLAAVTLDEALLLLEKNIPLNVISILDFSNGADKLIAKSSVETLTDLKGKSIVVENTALGAFLLSSALQKAGLNNKDVTIVHGTVDQHEKLFSSPDVSAAVTFEPTASQLEQAGGKALFDSSQMEDGKIIDILIAQPSVVAKHNKRIDGLIQKIHKAALMLREGDQQAVEIAKTNLGADQSQLDDMLSGVILGDETLNKKYLNRYKLESTMFLLESVMVENQLLKNSIKDKISGELIRPQSYL